MRIFLLLCSFALLANAYDPLLAEKLAFLTSCTYCNQDQVQEWSCIPCKAAPIEFHDVTPIYNETGNCLTLVGLIDSPQSIVVLFRGTIPWDLWGWLQSMDFFMTPYPYCDNHCQVHHGFFNLYEQMAANIRKVVNKYKHKYGISEVTVVGHSLGAALAVISAADLVAHGIQITRVYSFGCPRLGDKKFTEWYERALTSVEQARVTRHKDPVTQLPPAQLGYHHVSHQIFYEGDKYTGYKICEDSGTKEDPDCSKKYPLDLKNSDHQHYYDIDFNLVLLSCQ